MLSSETYKEWTLLLMLITFLHFLEVWVSLNNVFFLVKRSVASDNSCIYLMSGAIKAHKIYQFGSNLFE